MFDPQDHFKGNYHKDKKVEPKEVNFPILPSGFNDIGEIDQVYHSTYGWIDRTLADKIKYINSPLPNDQIDLCDHELIDVGFSKPKLVCKKCDKDLC